MLQERMIQAALELEVAEFFERFKYSQDFSGWFSPLKRNGHHRERTISTPFGSLEVKVPRVSDTPKKFESNLVKKYKRRSEGLDCLFGFIFQTLQTALFNGFKIRFCKRRSFAALQTF